MNALGGRVRPWAAAVAGLLAIVGGVLVSTPATATAARTTRVPQPATASSAVRGGLNGVYCFGTENCWATGYSLVGPPYGGIVLHWDKGRWSSVPVPYPTRSRDSSLGTITCFGADDCLAEGHYGNTTSEHASYFDRWDGKRWTLSLSTQPSGYSAGSTSCFGPAACWALAIRGGDAVRIERWKGSHWELGGVLSAGPGASKVRLLGLSCLSSTDCTAVGSEIVTATGQRQVLVDRLRGTQWSVSPTPTVADASAPQLNGVACVSASACEAVGGRSIGTGNGGPGLIERWNGVHWSVTADPSRPDPGAFQFAGVSCRNATSCQAWGLGAGAGGFAGWNGSHWTTEGQTARLATSGVFCYKTSRCLAVGTTATHPDRLAASSFDTSRWTTATVKVGA